MDAILALADGKVYKGTAFGSSGTSTGEICFNTSMTGYQEIITDPSYRGQIVTMTYPEIGNYGVNVEDAESSGPHVRGLIIEELSPVVSNFRATQSLGEYFKEHDIIGVEEIDTRSLTKHLREVGAMQACITTELSAEEAVKAAQSAPSMAGSDFVKEVSVEGINQLTDSSLELRRWDIPNFSMNRSENYHELKPTKYKLVAYDFGIKYNILRNLRQVGFDITLVNSRTPASEVLAMKPDGIFLSNGPGDPAALDYLYGEIQQLLGKVPVFGICLGCQLLAHALGGKTYKLKFGHRGGNQPVKDLRSNKVSITSQNHGFAIDQDSLPEEVNVTHVNLSDGTVEGIAHASLPVFAVQYHPEAAPGPNDASYFFEEFADLVAKYKTDQ